MNSVEYNKERGENMAEFCKKCFEKDFGDLVKSSGKIVMSKEKDICEGCGKVDYTVDRVKNKGLLDGVVESIKRFGM